MRPMVVRLARDEKPTPEHAQILDELGDDRAEPGMLYLIDDATQAIIWPAFLFLRASYGSTGKVTEQHPVPSFATNLSNGVQKGPPIGVEEGPPFQII